MIDLPDMSADRPVWQEFDPSTFTFLGRNDIAVNWLIDYRNKYGLLPIKEILLLGSGAVEPFTLAALSEDFRVTAVEINEGLVDLGNRVKKGDKIPWDLVAERSLNPGRPNSDLLDHKRLENCMSVLKNLGSLQKLGSDFDLEGMGISSNVRNRVTFVKTDALSALRVNQSRKHLDLIGDFFLRVNINKHDSGPNYSARMLRESFDCLGENGMLLIGDTGKNLPVTYRQFADFNTFGRLNFASVVHFVNFGSGKTTSHYLLATKLSDFPGSDAIKQSLRSRLKENDILRKLSPIEEKGNVIDQVELSTEKVNIAFVDSGKPGESAGWNSSPNQKEALELIVPEAGEEVSETIIFPAQKPYLKTC